MRDATTARVVGRVLAAAGSVVEEPARLAAVVTAVVSSQWAPHRHYHTPVHLDEMLAEVARLDTIAGPAADGHHAPDDDTVSGSTQRAAVVAAIAWHDVVYDPRRTDNEAASARQARADLAGLAAREWVDRVAELVMVTADHDPGPHDPHAALLVDADLWILAAPATRHAAYARQVRREYAHLDDTTWRDGRGRVLRDLRAAVATTGYRVGPAPDRHDRTRRALANLDRELTTLA